MANPNSFFVKNYAMIIIVPFYLILFISRQFMSSCDSYTLRIISFPHIILIETKASHLPFYMATMGFLFVVITILFLILTYRNAKAYKQQLAIVFPFICFTNTVTFMLFFALLVRLGAKIEDAPNVEEIVAVFGLIFYFPLEFLMLLLFAYVFDRVKKCE